MAGLGLRFLLTSPAAAGLRLRFPSTSHRVAGPDLFSSLGVAGLGLCFPLASPGLAAAVVGLGLCFPLTSHVAAAMCFRLIAAGLAAVAVSLVLRLPLGLLGLATLQSFHRLWELPLRAQAACDTIPVLSNWSCKLIGTHMKNYEA